MSETVERKRVNAWRARAEEIRAVAGAFGDGNARSDLYRVAEQWEAMARQLESRLPIDLSSLAPEGERAESA